MTLTFDLLILKMVCEYRVMWATSVPFGLPRPLCFRLRPDVPDIQTDRQTSDIQTDVRQKHRLMPPPIRGEGIIISDDLKWENNVLLK